MIVQPEIRNSKGELVTLTPRELARAQALQRKWNEEFKHDLPSLMNALGYEVSITTLTTVIKKFTTQKFFEVAPADYMPVVVGEGAWSTNLTTFRSFDAADDFETGLLNTGADSAKMAQANAGVDSVTSKVFNWAKGLDWTIFDLEYAARAGNWSVVEAKEKARKRNWDLGIQRIAFLGAKGLNGSTGACQGLLALAGVNTNTTTITKAISSMSVTELKTFVATIINDYRANCSRSAWPTHWAIPESDYLGLVSPASADFPIKSTLQYLEEAFKEAVPNGKFKKILPLSYADQAYHADVSQIAGKQVYTLLNYDEETIRMDIPVDYTSTLANTINGFSFQNAAYGQFTGVRVLRPAEVLYHAY
jgi:hypothetical protein